MSGERAPDGDVIAGRYRLEDVAGAGGMGVVYRAIDIVSGVRVALKTIREGNPEVAVRFQREGALLRELEAPGIVRYLDHGASPSGELYLAMEWLDGEVLSERLRREPLSIRETLAVARAVALALATAHARGIVHRDIKPANLFLVENDPARAKVLDFGLAWIGSAASRQTHTGIVLGTPGYMAPEQALADREVDARVDVFSLGAVLYECLAGRPPFVADHPMALFAKIVLEDPPRIGTVRPGVPAALDQLLWRMLAKDRTDRPADARAVLDALAGIDSDDDARMTAEPAKSLTSSLEKQLVCIALASPPAATMSFDATVMESPVTALRKEMSSLGASIEQLADGAVVAIVVGGGVATDRATAAARCALTLRDRFADRAVVLTTGLAVVEGRFPTGEVIDRAVALLRSRRGGAQDGVWVDDVTAGLVRGRFEIAERAGAQLLVGAREELDDTRTLLGKPTPFVGRERDLSFLLGLFEEASNEPIARVVLVTAPAGTGKSRLRHEFLRRIAVTAPDAEIWFGRGDPIAVGAPFALVAPAIRRAARVLDGEPAESRRQKLASRVAKHVPEDRRARVTEFLCELVGAPVPDPEASVQLRSARQNPLQMADQMRSAWEDLVGAECAAHPLVLVLEDLHWGDFPSVKYVDAVLRAHQDKPLFVLALARPEVHETFPRLWSERRVQELALAELTKRAAASLARHALGAGTSEELISRVVERAAGNAFYLEELVRALAEGKGLVTDTVLAMVQARTQTLPAEARRILRAASVFGEVFWRGGVAELCGESPADVEHLLKDLTRRELFVRREQASFPAEVELAFRHGLVREGAYAMLTDEDRQKAHFGAGVWLERVGEASSLVLADHFERGGARQRAAEHYARAAHQAFDGGDLALAADCAGRGLAAGAEGELRGDLAATGCFAQAWRASWSEAVRLGVEAMALCPPGSKAWSLAASSVAFAGLTLGDPAQFMPVLEALCTVEPIENARSALAWAIETTTTIIYFGGGPRAIVERLLERLEIVARPVMDTEPNARGNFERGSAYEARYLKGDLAAAAGWARRALASFEESGDRPTMALVALDLATILVQLGQLAEASAMTRAIIESTDALGLELPGSFARVALARVACELGDADTIRSCVDWITARQEQAGYQAALVLQPLAEHALRTGDAATAEAEARRALARLSPTSTDALVSRSTLARALLALGRTAEALAIAEEAAARTDDSTFAVTDECGVFTTLAQARIAAGLDATDALARAKESLSSRAARIADPETRRRYLEELGDNRRTVALVRDKLGETIA